MADVVSPPLGGNTLLPPGRQPILFRFCNGGETIQKTRGKARTERPLYVSQKEFKEGRPPGGVSVVIEIQQCNALKHEARTRKKQQEERYLTAGKVHVFEQQRNVLK